MTLTWYLGPTFATAMLSGMQIVVAR